MSKLFKNQHGQALMEMAMSLMLFAALLYGLDYLASAVIVRNRALSYQHHLLTQSFREAEHCETTMAPPSNDRRMQLLGDHESRKQNLKGADYASIKPGQYVLRHTFLPNFSAQSQAYLDQGQKTFSFTAHTFHDPWQDNEVYVAALWALALGRALAGNSNEDMQGNTQKLSSTNLGPGAKGGQQQTLSQFQMFTTGDAQQGDGILSSFKTAGFSSQDVPLLQNQMQKILGDLSTFASQQEDS